MTIGDFSAKRRAMLRGAVECGSLRHHFADQTHAKRGGGIEGIAEKQWAERLMLSDQPRQMHKVQRRDQPDIDFRIAECSGFAGDDHVARYRYRHAAGARRPVDGGDGRFAHSVLHVIECKVETFEKKLGFGAALAAHDVEIEPGAKHLVRAANDHGAYGLVVSRLFQRRQQGVYQRHAQRVDRPAVERDLRHRIRDGIANEFSGHGAWSPVG